MRLVLLFLGLSPWCLAADQDEPLNLLLGNFRYLVDAQVRCDGDYDAGTYICNKEIPGQRRILGTWDSYIVAVGVNDALDLRFVDSNLFVTAQTLLPLYQVRFEDPYLEDLRRRAIYDGMSAVNLFRRRKGFAFWPRLGPSRIGQVDRIGPLNISPLILSSQLEMIERMERLLRVSLFPHKVRWMEEHLDLDNESIGMDALFSVPDDADDTALGIIGNYYFYRDREGDDRMDHYLGLVDVFGDHVDTLPDRHSRRYRERDPACARLVGSGAALPDLFGDTEFLRLCSLDDPRESWRYAAYDSGHSGAFLTWLYDEHRPIYDDPEAGVALPGQNSVDCNAMTNVLYALSLTETSRRDGMREGYEASCNAITNIVLDGNDELRQDLSPRKVDAGRVPVWHFCGLFFPAHMSFPYLVSRAVADGGACRDLPATDQARFDTAMKTLVRELAREQDEQSAVKERGQWYEKVDGTVALPTALGGVSLLNFGHAYGDQAFGEDIDIRSRTGTAFEHVVSLSDVTTGPDGATRVSLPEGTYFGGGTVDEIAHWRSRAFSTAVSLEFAAKYLRAYGGGFGDVPVVVPGIRSSSQRVAAEFERPLPIDYVPDRLDPLTESPYGLSATLGASTGNRGPELRAGVELSLGEHLRGNVQEEVEKVAHYASRLNASLAYNQDSGRADNYEVDLRFLGISTRTSYIIQDDVGHLPSTYRLRDNVITRSMHLRYGQVSLPILATGGGGRLSFDAMGRLLGVVHREYDRGTSTNSRRSANFADFRLGLTFVRDRLRASVACDSGLGYSTDSDGNHYSSHRNYGLTATLEYALGDRHALVLSGSRGRDGESRDLFDDDRAYLLYEYRWERRP